MAWMASHDPRRLRSNGKQDWRSQAVLDVISLA